MPDIEVKYVTKEKEPLTEETLPKKAWWRFAQAIFVLVSFLLLILTITVGVARILDADTIVSQESTLFCKNGEQIRLDVFEDQAGVYIYSDRGLAVESYPGENIIFSAPHNNAKAKMYCGLSFEGQAFSSSDFNRYYSGINKQQIDEAYETLEGVDIRYSLNITRDYTQMIDIVGYVLTALFVEMLLLILIRGIAKFTLIGKFF